MMIRKDLDEFKRLANLVGGQVEPGSGLAVMCFVKEGDEMGSWHAGTVQDVAASLSAILLTNRELMDAVLVELEKPSAGIVMKGQVVQRKDL